MERVIIIGNCGAGKSTLAAKLAKKLGLPLVHLDRLRFIGNWVERPREEFDEMLMRELEKQRWIIDGNYNRTIPLRMRYCDTVVFLDFPRFLCLWRVIKRVTRYHGKTRPDMGDNCPERFDLEFMKYVWQFRKKHRKRYLEMLSKAKDKNVVILRNPRQAEDFLKKFETEN